MQLYAYCMLASILYAYCMYVQHDGVLYVYVTYAASLHNILFPAVYK